MESIEILAVVVESVSNEKGIEEGIIFGASGDRYCLLHLITPFSRRC
jgi:hypothetical protein